MSGWSERAGSVSAGRYYVRFGVFGTNMVSDPLTLEIGETRETAVEFGFEARGAFGAVYLFEGSNQSEGDDKVGHWGATLGYRLHSDRFQLTASFGYINDLGDSDSLQDALGSNDVSDYTGGWSASALLEAGPFSPIGEYLGATARFDRELLAFGGGSAKPGAWNIEGGYGFRLLERDATFALGCQGSAEALALELPKRRWLAGPCRWP